MIWTLQTSLRTDKAGNVDQTKEAIKNMVVLEPSKGLSESMIILKDLFGRPHNILHYPSISKKGCITIGKRTINR